MNGHRSALVPTPVADLVTVSGIPAGRPVQTCEACSTSAAAVSPSGSVAVHEKYRLDTPHGP